MSSLRDADGLEPFRVHLPGRALTLSGLQRGLTPPGQGRAAGGSSSRGNPGPVVLFIHGAAGYGAYWRRLARRLPEHWSLLAPDLRGHGHSDKPDAGYDLRSVAGDLMALLDAFHVERAVLVGHSWGGKVALAAAGLHPERAEHVVAVDPASLAPHTTLADVRQGLVRYFDTLYGPHESFEAAVERVRSLVEAIPGRRWTAESERNLRAALQRLPDGRWVGTTPPAVVRAVLASAEGENAAPLLRDIRCPVTLAITRERAGEFAGLESRLAPGADLVVEVFDCSHWIPSDRPDELAALMRARLG